MSSSTSTTDRVQTVGRRGDKFWLVEDGQFIRPILPKEARAIMTAKRGVDSAEYR